MDRHNSLFISGWERRRRDDWLGKVKQVPPFLNQWSAPAKEDWSIGFTATRWPCKLFQLSIIFPVKVWSWFHAIFSHSYILISWTLSRWTSTIVCGKSAVIPYSNHHVPNFNFNAFEFHYKIGILVDNIHILFLREGWFGFSANGWSFCFWRGLVSICFKFCTAHFEVGMCWVSNFLQLTGMAASSRCGFFRPCINFLFT